MANTKNKKRQRENKIELQEALAALIASTRRKKRKLNLLEVVKYLDVAVENLGSLKAVAQRIEISNGMLEQFASIKKLSADVKRLLAERKIESVDVAHRLSKLSPSDHGVVASVFSAGLLDSDDVRAIVSLRKKLPIAEIDKVIERVVQSRNIKEYEIQFIIQTSNMGIRALRNRFVKLVGDENIRSFNLKEGVGILVVNSKGRKRLQEAAKQKKITKRELITNAIKEKDN